MKYNPYYTLFHSPSLDPVLEDNTKLPTAGNKLNRKIMISIKSHYHNQLTLQNVSTKSTLQARLKQGILTYIRRYADRRVSSRKTSLTS